MLSSTFLVVAALAAASVANPVDVKPAVDYGNANFYIDLVLFNVNRALPDFIPLPDIGGPFNFHNCIFYGTEYGLRRDGDATLVTTGNSVKFVAAFKMRDVGLSCDWKYGLLGGSVSGVTPNVGISSGMTLILDHGQHPWLTEFRVTTLDPISVDITGLTAAFNWLVEDITEWILKDIGDEITYVIENNVKDLFQDVLNTMVIP